MSSSSSSLWSQIGNIISIGSKFLKPKEPDKEYPEYDEYGRKRIPPEKTLGEKAFDLAKDVGMKSLETLAKEASPTGKKDIDWSRVLPPAPGGVYDIESFITKPSDFRARGELSGVERLYSPRNEVQKNGYYALLNSLHSDSIRKLNRLGTSSSVDTSLESRIDFDSATKTTKLET